MKSYKVEFTQTETYVIDVQAENEEQAEELANKKWDEIPEGFHQYHQTGDTITEMSNIYDVTGTDDAINN